MDFIGIVEVPIARLLFVEGSGQRLFNKAHQNHLTDLFRDTEADHTNARHLIDGYLDGTDAESILQEAGLSSQQIRQLNFDGRNPVLNATVRYTHGQHRVEAARVLDARARWTVRLYRTDIMRLSSTPAVRKQTEQYQHEMSYSDGHIYSKLRHYPRDTYFYNMWYHRLSENKQIGLQNIDKRVGIALALNKLIRIPALLDELLLTSFQKFMTLRLDHEVLRGIEKLHAEFSRLAGGNMTILQQMDKKTLAAVAGRAPGIHHDDHQFIDIAFSSGHLFPSLHNPAERDSLKRRVQQTVGFIPSLLSLQSNLGFLGIAAKIIWDYLLPRTLRRKARDCRLSLRTILQYCWEKETSPYVEIREGEFALASGPPCFDLVYVQIFLSALRQFPYLCCVVPKVERGEKLRYAIDPHHVAQFCRRAKFLGIKTDIIDENIKAFAPRVGHKERCQFQPHEESEVLARLDSRWGRPTTSIYTIIRRKGFLPTILDKSENLHLGAIPLLRNTIVWFFRVPSFSIELPQVVHSINLQQIQPQHQPYQSQQHYHPQYPYQPQHQHQTQHQYQTQYQHQPRHSPERLGLIIEESDMDIDSRSDLIIEGSDMDIDSRSDEKSGSDVSMQDIDIDDAAVQVATDLTATASPTSISYNPVQNFSPPLNAQDGRYDTGTARLARVQGIANAQASRVEAEPDRDSLEPARQSRSLIRSTSAIRSPLRHPRPLSSQLHIGRWDGEQGRLPHISTGESAMTPPQQSSVYESGDLNWSLASFPTSPNQQSSSLIAGLTWHQTSDRFSGDTLLTSVNLPESALPLSIGTTPRRLSDIPTTFTPILTGTSDGQSGMSLERSSYHHGGSSLQAISNRESGTSLERSSYMSNLSPQAPIISESGMSLERSSNGYSPLPAISDRQNGISLEQSSYHHSNSPWQVISDRQSGTSQERSSYCISNLSSQAPILGISDRRSGTSLERFSYYHGNLPSQDNDARSPISGSTATRSAYTAQLPSFNRHLWQGFEDSDDDLESVNIN